MRPLYRSFTVVLLLFGCEGADEGDSVAGGPDLSAERTDAGLPVHPSRCGHLAWWPGSHTYDREEGARAALNILASAAERYCALQGNYPASIESIFRLPDTVWESWVCIPRREWLRDPWGTPLAYEADGIPVLRSAGPDRLDRTPDDIFGARASDPGALPIDMLECRRLKEYRP